MAYSTSEIASRRAYKNLKSEAFGKREGPFGPGPAGTGKVQYQARRTQIRQRAGRTPFSPYSATGLRGSSKGNYS